MRRILHLSDLHFGKTDKRITRSVLEFATELQPDLIVISGDLTQRAKPRQFRAAHDFLAELPQKPQLVIPGNHDIPLFNPFVRFWNPFGRYARHITPDLSPAYEDEEIAVYGVTTPRRHMPTNGRIHANQLEWIRQRVKSLPEKTVRVLVTHHPSNRLRSRDLFFAGLDLMLSGHTHWSRVRPTSEFIVADHRSALVVEAGTATSTRLRGESNSFNLITIHDRTVTVAPYSWDEDQLQFEIVRGREFRLLGEAGWAA